MAGDALLRIGPFSRASSLSIKALRAYHESGLLVPAAVDPQTGYRSYSVAQLTDATIIRRLRELDVPLEAIRDVLDARDPEVTRKVLTEHGAALEQRLATMQRTIEQLYRALEAPAAHTPVHRRHEEARLVLAIEAAVTEAEWQGFLRRARGRLGEVAAVTGVRVSGAFGGCYPPQADDDVQQVIAFLPVEDPPLIPAEDRAAGVRVSELAAGEVAVLAHEGSYDTLPDSYRTLGAWVASEAEPADLPVRELYLVGPEDTDEPGAYRTEICWPLRPHD